MSGNINGINNSTCMGQINAQSLKHRRNHLFNKLDSNSDGGIDKTEFSDFAKKLAQSTGKTLNVDDIYSKYDTDASGSLSKDEMKAFMKDNAPRPPEGEDLATLIARMLKKRQDDLFKKIDTNKDGGIDKTEIAEFIKKISEDTGKTFNIDDIFSQYDADGSGSLNSDELQAFMKDNEPSRPTQAQNALSSYGNIGNDQNVTVMESIQAQMSSDTNSSTQSALLGDYLTKLLQSFKTGTSASVLNITA